MAGVLKMPLGKLAHCDKIFQEKTSGASTTRPRFGDCLDYIREGDTLVVHLHVLDQSIDTSHATGRLLFHMLGAIAQFETELRAERQREGIQKAQARGVHFGRQKQLTPVQIRVLCCQRNQGVLIKTLMHDYGLSKVTVYR